MVMDKNNYDTVNILMVTKYAGQFENLADNDLPEGYEINSTEDLGEARECLHDSETRYDVVLAGTELENGVETKDIYEEAREFGAVPAVFSVRSQEEISSDWNDLEQPENYISKTNIGNISEKIEDLIVKGAYKSLNHEASKLKDSQEISAPIRRENPQVDLALRVSPDKIWEEVL